MIKNLEYAESSFGHVAIAQHKEHVYDSTCSEFRIFIVRTKL